MCNGAPERAGQSACSVGIGSGRSFTPPRELIFRRALRAALRGCESVLDVGCGGTSRPARAGFRGVAVGVDVSWHELLAARRLGGYTALVRAEAASVERCFRPGSVDAAIALDVIEHLERDAALGLIAGLERVARRRVVIFTPNGFVPQPPEPENPHQEHRSGFTADEMRALGYRVRGIHGLGCLCGPFAQSRWRPGLFWRRVSDLTALPVYFLPRLAFALFCTKDVHGADGRRGAGAAVARLGDRVRVRAPAVDG